MPKPAVNQFGPPFCGACNYDLSGATESSKCPECGRPIVEVLMREGVKTSAGRRYESEATLMGLPVLSIALGAHGEERTGRAKGIVAIGDVATGGLAIGGRATGVVAVGGMAMGGVTLGGLNVGVLGYGGLTAGIGAMGGMAVGLAANGGMALGLLAQGGVAIGWAARGGVARAAHVPQPGGTDLPSRLFDALEIFFGASGPTGMLLSQIFPVVVALVLGGLIALVAWMASGKVRGETLTPPGGGA